MAIEIVNNQDTIDNFKTKVNTLSRLIGDLSLLDIKDSNVMDAINRIDITDISGAIVARADVDSAALVAYRVLQDSATAADTLARVTGDSANLALINANIATLAKRDSAGYIAGLGFTHAQLSSINANQHIDWTADQDGTVIDAANYTNSQSTYSSIHTGITGSGLTAQSGATVVSSITVNDEGHVTGASTRELTAANVSALASNGTATQANALLDDSDNYGIASYANTASLIVRRDASKNIAVNTVNLGGPAALASPTNFLTLSAATGDIQYTTVANTRAELSAADMTWPRSSGILFSDGGGFRMTDASWVRNRGDKPIYCNVNLGGNATASYVTGPNAVGFATNGDVAAGWSDMRLKTKVGELDNALEKVCSLSGFLYQSSDLALEYDLPPKDVIKVGLSAQEVQKVLPEVVSGAPMNIDHGTDFLNVDYAKLVPLLIEAIKELKDQVDRIKA
jgi:hypothetical protein